jgi:hypothetical protein
MTKKEEKQEEKEENKKEEEQHIPTPEESFRMTVGYIYILENMKYRFDLTQIEIDAIDSAIEVLHIAIGDDEDHEESPESAEHETETAQPKRGRSVQAVAGYA